MSLVWPFTFYSNPAQHTVRKAIFQHFFFVVVYKLQNHPSKFEQVHFYLRNSQNQTDTDHLSELPMKIEMSSTQYVYDICKYPKKVLSKSDIFFQMILVQVIQKIHKIEINEPFLRAEPKSAKKCCLKGQNGSKFS